VLAAGGLYCRRRFIEEICGSRAGSPVAVA